MRNLPPAIVTRRPTPLPTGDAAVRELMAVREIAHSFLTADRPEEVFQFALDRVSPLVGATFASVYVVDGASELMRLAAAFNWPEKYRPFLGEVRVRLGHGPSGKAASEKTIVQVPDVFADPSLTDWQEVAKELGFRALVALPLQTGTRVLGTVTFYFAERGGFGVEARGLLRTVADQMAATAEKASLIEELRRANAALVDSHSQLEQQYLEMVEARRVKDEFLSNVSHELRTPLTAVMGYISLMREGVAGPMTGEQLATLSQANGASERLLTMVEDLLDLTTLRRGDIRLDIDELDPREVLRDTVAAVRNPGRGVELLLEEPTSFLPPMRTDRRKVVRVLSALLENAYKFTSQGEVRLGLVIAGGRVRFSVADTGIGIPEDARHMVFEEFRQLDSSPTRRYGGSGLGLALARRLARLLGGDITVESTVGAGSTFTVELPLEMDSRATVKSTT